MSIHNVQDIEVDFGQAFEVRFRLDGWREPHYLEVSNGDKVIMGLSDCSGTNDKTCVRQISDSDADWSFDGDFTVVAKNRARNENEITATDRFKITVYQVVSSELLPREYMRII